MSGGQKQRISLARAVYNDADVYFLDDPLSAVDSHVGKHLFDKVIGLKGILRNKTRILVTHKIAVLPYVDEIIVIKDGHISESGSYSQLINSQGSFADFLTEYLTEGSEEIVEPEDLEVIEELSKIFERRLSRLSSRGCRRRKFSLRNSSTINENDLEELRAKFEKDKKEEKSKLISSEELNTGRVRIYFDYIKAIGIVSSLIILISYIVASSFTIGTSVWLSEWSNDAHTNNSQTVSSNERLEIYGALGLGQTFFILIATITLNLACLRGSKILHEQMLNNVIRSPMSFFDTTPIGLLI